MRREGRLPFRSQYGIVPYTISATERSTPMSHVAGQKRKLVARVRRIKGQLDAAERALEAEASCAEVLRLIASAQGALNGLTLEVMENHLRAHVLEAKAGEARRRAGEELIDVMRSYMK
jgi:DNA-binding FrmR family transcriptional regulator